MFAGHRLRRLRRRSRPLGNKKKTIMNESELSFIVWGDLRRHPNHALRSRRSLAAGWSVTRFSGFIRSDAKPPEILIRVWVEEHFLISPDLLFRLRQFYKQRAVRIHDVQSKLSLRKLDSDDRIATSWHLLFNGFSCSIEHNINLLTGIHDVLPGWKLAELAVLFEGPRENVATHLAVQRIVKESRSGSD
jgi:hypothetical protein